MDSLVLSYMISVSSSFPVGDRERDTKSLDTEQWEFNSVETVSGLRGLDVRGVRSGGDTLWYDDTPSTSIIIV